MDKKITYGIIGILVLLVVTLLILKSPTTTINQDSETQYLQKIENAFIPSEYICGGGYCWVDDAQIYLNCTEESLSPECTLKTKTYTGNADVVFLFDTTEVKPVSLEYNPQIEEVTHNFVCNYDYVINTTSKYIKCFETLLENGTIPYNNTYWEGTYSSVSAQTKTISWITHKTTWTKYNGDYTKEYIDFKNMTRKYTLPNISFTAGVERTFRLNLDAIDFTPKHKYWIGIKPSGLTWIEAIAQNKYFVLDPWTPDLNDGLRCDYALNYTSGPVLDSTGQQDGTNYGATRGTTGKLNNSFTFTGTTSRVNTTRQMITAGQEWTVNVWANGNAASDTAFIVSQSADGSGRQRVAIRQSTTAWQAVTSQSDLTQLFLSSTSTVDTSNWVMITARRNSTSLAIFINGSVENVVAWDGTDIASTNQFWIGERGAPSTGGFSFDGDVDQVNVWNKSLSDSQITALWNSGNGLAYSTALTPVILISYPLDGVIYNESVNVLNYTVSNGEYCWYSADGGITNSSFVTAGTNFSISSMPQWNNFTVYCNSSTDDIGLNTTDFYVNKSAGSILIQPPTGTLTKNSSVLFEYNNTPINVNLTNATFYLWYSNNTLYTSRFYTLSGNETINNKTIIVLSDNFYKWNVQTCGDDGYCNYGSSNFTFNLDSTPPVFNITYPSGTLGAVIEGSSLFLNWTLTEENIVKNCSYTYNGTVTNLVNTTCVQNYTTFNYVAGQDNLSMIVWDYYNNSASDTTSWIVSLSEINQSYQNTTIEGAYENFLSWFTLYPGLAIESATLVYNGTEYSGSVFHPGSNYYYTTTDIVIPEVSADTNLTFYWEFFLNDSSTITSLSHNQTVLNVALDNCSSYTTKFYNFSLVDEEHQTPINGTVELAFSLYNSDRTLALANYSDIYNLTDSFDICMSEALTGSLNLSLDGIVRYEGTDVNGTTTHANEYYNIVDKRIYNTTVYSNITLYDLNLSDSTEFQLTFTGDDYLPVENALIYIDRQYISENKFKTVELPLTDSNGQTIIHLVRNDVIYNIRVMKDGVLLGAFNNIVAYCEDYTIGDCKINLNSADSNTDIFNYDDQLGITFTTPTYNETSNRVRFTFVSTDGESKVVYMNITRDNVIGNRSVCNTTSTGASGTLLCSLSSVSDSTLRVSIYVDDQLVITKSFNLSGNNYGTAGYLVYFVMVISFVFLFSSSKSGVLFGIFLGFIAGVGLGIIQGSVIGLGAAGLWLLLIVIIGIWKLNKNRPQ